MRSAHRAGEPGSLSPPCASGWPGSRPHNALGRTGGGYQGEAGTGRELTPAEAAQWWHDVETRNVEVKGPTRYIISVGGEAHVVGKEDLPPEYRKTFGVDTDDPAGND